MTFLMTNLWWQFWWQFFMTILTTETIFENFDNFENWDNWDNFWQFWQLKRQSWRLVTFETLRTILTIEKLNSVNHSYLTINFDTGQHSQFLRCFAGENGTEGEGEPGLVLSLCSPLQLQASHCSRSNDNIFFLTRRRVNWSSDNNHWGKHCQGGAGGRGVQGPGEDLCQVARAFTQWQVNIMMRLTNSGHLPANLSREDFEKRIVRIFNHSFNHHHHCQF